MSHPENKPVEWQLINKGANLGTEGGVMGAGPRGSWCRGLGLKFQYSNASNKESEKNNYGPLNCMISSGTPGILSVSSSILCVHWSVCECVRSEGTERSGEGGVFEITWLICGG